MLSKHLSPKEFLAKEVSGLSNVLTQREQKRGLEGSAPNWQWPEADSEGPGLPRCELVSRVPRGPEYDGDMAQGSYLNPRAWPPQG